jgi:hypothetical protein
MLDPGRYPDENGDRTPQATAELHGYSGTVIAAAQISQDGRTISATVGHSAFAARDWRCVRGNSNEADPDVFAFAFAGYEPKELTPASARTTLPSELTRRYGPEWDRAGSWTACPRDEFAPDGFSGHDPRALCEFRFRDGLRWRHGSVILTEKFGDIQTTYFSSTTFIKTMRRRRPLDRFPARGYSIAGYALAVGSDATACSFPICTG